VAERVTGIATPQAAYIAAVVVSAAIVGPLEMVPRATTYLVHVPGTRPEELVEDLIDAWWGGFFRWLILGGAATFVYVDRRRAQAAQATRHAAELRRANSARRTLESRLQAMQARVEPQFLFNTLAQVRERYREDPRRAGQMLDNLIAYLRAAMPKMRDTSSTIGQEMELAQAYLDIVKVRVGERLSYVIDCAEEMRDRRFPPMLVLPLIDHAIARGLEGSGAAGSIGIRVEPGMHVTVAISHGGGGFGPETAGEDIERMRKRLDALFAGRATLRLEHAGGTATRAVLRVPSEPSQSASTVTGS
jgi:LytS/YehU family sensor histidine kinase